MPRLLTDDTLEPADSGLRAYAAGPSPLDEADELLADAEAWLESTALLPDEAARRALRADLEEVRARRETLLTPLRIAIVGGTGVGKSTLLNALAGAPIAEAGARRPTTQHLTAYVHEANRLSLDPALAPEPRRVAHQRDGLLDKILFDTPDFDSVETDHRGEVEAALDAADVVLWVTTAEKYADLAGARWLTAYREGRTFVFLLNRADEGVEAALEADVRRHMAALGFPDAPLLAVSAKQAFEQKQAGASVDAPFARLEHLLEHELDAKRIRAVKQANLLDLVAWLARRLAEASLPDAGPRLRGWRTAAEAEYDRLRQELASRLTGRVAADPRLRHHIEYWFGFAFGGPVGTCLSAVYALRAVFSPAYPRLWQVSDAPAVEAAGDEGEAEFIAGRVVNTQARLRALAADSGLPGGATADLGALDPSAARALAHAVDQRLGETFGTALRGAREERPLSHRLLGLVLNLPTLAVLIGLPVAILINQFEPIWGDGRVVAWQAGLLAIVFWLALVTAVAQAAVRRRTRRFLHATAHLVARALDGALRDPLLGRLERHLARLEADAARLEEVVRRAER